MTVTLSDPPGRDDNARFTTVPLKHSDDKKNVEDNIFQT